MTVLLDTRSTFRRSYDRLSQSLSFSQNDETLPRYDDAVLGDQCVDIEQKKGCNLKCWTVARGSELFRCFRLIDTQIAINIREDPKLRHHRYRSLDFGISCCLIGPDRETLTPFIIIHCGDKDFLKDVLRSAEKLETWKSFKRDYPHFLLRGMPYGPLVQVARNGQSVRRQFKIVPHATKVFAPLLQFRNDSTTTLSTLGGALYLNDKWYILTAGHVLVPDTIDIGLPCTPHRSTEQDEIARNTIDSGFESMQSQYSTANTEDESGALFSMIFRRVQDRDLVDPTVTVHNCVNETDVTNDWSRGHVTLTSIDFPNNGLDYCLCSLEEGDVASSTWNSISQVKAVKPVNGGEKVILRVASREPIEGVVGKSILSYKARNSTTFVDVNPVRVNDDLVQGDCGSWVLDDQGCWLGHVIGYDANSRTAYFVAATDIINDITDRGFRLTSPVSEMARVVLDRPREATHGEASDISINALPVVQDENTTKWYQLLLAKHSQNNVQGQAFVNVTKLISWMKAPSLMNEKTTNVELLLARYAGNENLELTNRICGLNGHPPCILLFAILLEIGEGHLVEEFIKGGVHDETLPIDVSMLEACTRRINLNQIADRATIAEKFFHAQWKFRPAVLEHEAEWQCPRELVIPFFEEQLISNKGATAKVYRAHISEDFVHERLKDYLSHARFKHTEYDWCYRIAIKRFPSKHKELFENERTAFRTLNDKTGILKCFGSYVYDDNNDAKKGTQHNPSLHGETVYNLLLDHAECDLEEYFRTYPPPVSEDATSTFWSQMISLAEAVNQIHNLQTPPLKGVHENYGWHADIKPANILIFDQQADRQFKLADLGFATFVQKTQGSSDDQRISTLRGGTITYGAPEVHVRHNTGVMVDSRAADVWSLGCVFSLAATWVIGGNNLLEDYKLHRRQAVKNSQRWSNNGYEIIPDMFHDGKNILPEIHRWHNVIRGCVRTNDKFTSRIIDILDEHMLLDDWSSRISADALYLELLSIERSFTKATRSMASAHVKSDSSLQQIRISATAEHAISKPSKTMEAGFDIAKTSLRDQPQVQPGTSPIVQQSQNTGSASETIFNHITTISPVVSSFKSLRSKAFQVKPQLPSLGWPLKRQPDKLLKRYYENRDLIFLVDNGASMKQHWDKVAELLADLVSLSQFTNSDGMGLYFTNTGKGVRSSNTMYKFEAAMNDSKHQPQLATQTHMEFSLEALFASYRLYFTRNGSTTKKLTIIVLTDGLWAETANSTNIEAKIIALSKESKIGRSLTFPNNERPFSITFVQFGYDHEARTRLQRLDDGLKHRGLADIVDAHASTEGLYTILVGSIDTSFDNVPFDSASTSQVSEVY